MNNIFRATGLTFLASLTLLVGCGDGAIDTEQARGTITYEGQPVVGANVMFSPVTKGQGSPAYATTDEEGEFVLQTLQGAPGAGTTPGEYKVTVSKVKMVPTGRTRVTPEGTKEAIEEPEEVLPLQYKFQSRTPLTASVKENEENVFEFALEK